ncbi:MAG: hypothetical protein EOO50_15260 [Flavobacterium sp.]|uniref:hypothetical protein n=1 Tax=Flavobacterium sp. TaxID=239 RepID=UPI0012114A80|nr:hypothetical protein [Flavobacterium sp.]RZJ64559.1 MAG: hypothetical protein EOO50_15260 [Flavobacterium sp.]
MVEVFRTNVDCRTNAHDMILRLLSLHPNSGITFDLEDCDRILRIENATLDCGQIISLMEAHGFSCEILS